MEARLRPKYNNQDWEANQEQNVFCGAAAEKTALAVSSACEHTERICFLSKHSEDLWPVWGGGVAWRWRGGLRGGVCSVRGVSWTIS